MKNTSWFAKNVPEVLKDLDSNNNGLSAQEAGSRLQRYGYNRLPEAKSDALWMIFIRQFQSPLIYVLLIASLVVFLMGEVIDGSIILFVLIFNSIVGTIQEGKAQNTLQALKKLTETNARVLRDGKEMLIPDSEVVPGDIILLQEGDKIPSDARITLSHNLSVDESSLTGESLPINKGEETLSDPSLQIADQKNMVFKGTHVVSGNGQAVVVATGLETVIGKISKEIAVINTEIPLKANIRYLTNLIIIAVAVICTSIFIFGIATGHSSKEMFKTVVSLAVSIIPEGLPIVMTLVLATGVWRMSKRNALVKKLQAVEALGQARVIAVDKTGTLTKNEIMLQKVYLDGKTFTVGGIGYSPEGGVSLESSKINPADYPELSLAGKLAALITNNNVSIDPETKEWRATGDPTDSALSVFAHKIGFRKESLDKESPRLGEIPFDYKNRYHAVTFQDGRQKRMSVLGAPEQILGITTNIWRGGKSEALSKEQKAKLETELIKLSQEGLRILALAIKDSSPEIPQSGDVNDLTFVGFFGLRDSLRPEAKEAVETAIKAGIKVVMITGDHKVTAEAIAKEAGIYHPGDTILTGAELDALSEDQFAQIIDKVSVFARVTPDHKLKIINAYKKRGLVTAMTGDGVNDAPSLVAADLGVSMGKVGTEVAKEASDIVLLDDNFASIISAVEEGRSIYKTIKKVILYLFSTGFGEVFTITGALILGLPLPILAAQIVWLNFVTDGFLDVSLAMEPKEEGLLSGSFEHPKKYLIDWLSVQRMVLMSLTMMAGTLFLFVQYYQSDNIAKASTVALTVLAAYQWFNAWNCRNERKSIFQLNPFSNKFLMGATVIVIILQLFAVYNPFMQVFLRTTALDLSDWLIILPVAFTIIVVEEIRKLVYSRLPGGSL